MKKRYADLQGANVQKKFCHSFNPTNPGSTKKISGKKNLHICTSKICTSAPYLYIKKIITFEP
jgi:hypothetical protein